jgi:hypothetical protein
MPEVKASTQEHLEIYDIDQDLVLLKNGGVCLVLQTTAVNFNLLSEVEQDAIIGAYSGLLNSLSFPIQVLIRSKRMDISAYLQKLRQLEQEQANRVLRQRIGTYRDYAEQLVSKNEVLDKRFYIVIPHQEMVLTSPRNPLQRLFSRRQRFVLDKNRILKKAKLQLEPRKEHIIKQLNRLGLKARQLTTVELVSLFYDIYNPDLSRQQHLRPEAGEYTAPLVRPAVE